MALAFLSAGIPLSAQETVKIRAGTWPVLTDQDIANGFYTVKPDELSFAVDKFSIPANFKIVFSDKIKGPVAWTFNKMEFGVRCTIEANPRAKPAKPAKAQDGGSQPPWGEEGRPGGSGIPGTPGSSGITLSIHTGSVDPHGSLWIDTSGGEGGDGGDGGNGGLGGGWSCGFARETRTNGGRGGNGGDGGVGGRGGNQADVTITIGTVPPYHPIDPPPCEDGCGRPGMPETVEKSNSGLIALYGPGGCPGRGGQGGKGGKGGDGPSWNRKNCGTLFPDVYGGVDGADGRSGTSDNGNFDPCLSGQPGSCASTHQSPTPHE
jgi:hypothetical protein